MTAPEQVIELIKRFDWHRDAYRSGQYNETQLRREFLDPFFKALGWDVHNEQGYAEAYKDVIHEDAIKIGGLTKAPDYCFRIGGTRKFFVEAKKPSVNIKEDISPAFQLRRYAWSAKLPLSILTDFEEFAVYDCRIKPDRADKASTARTLYLNYAEYADRWDDITVIFSREAVLKGSFDKYVESTRAKKGTAGVDNAFLKEIEGWREALARNLALRNPGLTQRELNFAVQATIDRIVFLRICEDRGIEEYGSLMALQNGVHVYGRLLELFGGADERYNSGLFHFQREKDRPEPPDDLTPNLVIDDRPVKDIIRSLYYPDSPYEFSVLPADILGQVYEQFLGKVIRLTSGHRAVVEDKPEAKKAGGVYYTPTYIVDYIVDQTVGKLLAGKTPRQAAKIKILDPACGSGSFLIGAYQRLLDWHLQLYAADGPDKHRKELYQGRHGDWRLTTAEKKRILLNNIYGVDIDPQAVEVTKLSLLLKVLEGESEETLAAQLRFFQERALPDLGNNIKCGNSLIGSDFYDNQQMSLIDEEERYRINVFDWEIEFPRIFSTNKPGFDSVIGNPPYGAYLYESDKPYLKSKYAAQNYQLDSYLLFVERGVRDLLVHDGYFGMIIPNPWLTNILQVAARRFVVDNTRVVEIAHFMFKVFSKATVDTQILILQKTNPGRSKALITVAETLDAFKNLSLGEGIRRIQQEQDRWRHLNGGVINIFASPAEESLAEKCASLGPELSSLCVINVGIKPYQAGKGKPPQTRDTVEQRPFDSDDRLDESYRPCLRGSDIARYQVSPGQPRFLKYGPWLAEPRFSANFDAAVKIFVRQTGDSLIATIDTDRYLCLNNMHVLVPSATFPSPYYLLGIINSRLLNWYYQMLNPEKGEALAEVKKTNVARLPIRLLDMSRPPDKSCYDQVIGLVERILSLNERRAAARTGQERVAIERLIEATDRQIDRLVYELYGLTDQEIALVEGDRV